MRDNDHSNRPVLYGFFGAMFIGLASLFVWLLRFIARPEGREKGSLPWLATQHSASGEGDESQSATAVGAVPAFAGGEEVPAGTTGLASGRTAALQQLQSSPSTTSEGSTSWTAPTRYLAGVGILLFFLCLLVYSRSTLTMLIFAALVAIMVQPVIQFLRKRLRLPGGLSVMIVYLLVAALLIVLPILIVPNIINAIRSFFDFDWQGLVKGLGDLLGNLAIQVSGVPFIGAGLAETIRIASQAIHDLATPAPAPALSVAGLQDMLASIGRTLGLFGSVVGPLVSGALSLVFMLLISLQMSIAGREIRGWLLALIPERFKEETGSLLDRIMQAWVSFLRGQFALMVVMGLLVWLMNAILGTPHAMLLGLLAGFLEIIPSLGPTIATVPAALLALLMGSSTFPGLHPVVFMLIVIVAYVLLNLVENQVLVPRILGGAVELPALIVLVGAIVAGAQAGIAGVFLVTPMMATGKILLEYVHRKMNEMPEEQGPKEKGPGFAEQARSFVARIRGRFRRSPQEEKKPPVVPETPQVLS